MDVRAEHARFETLQQQLQGQQRLFLSQAGAALREDRAAVQPDQARWWWFLDERAAKQRKSRVRQALTWGLVAAGVLVVAGLLYDRFIAPSPEVREAFRHKSRGESLVEEGDLQAALVEFESATAFTPDDSESLLWQGVIHAELNEPDQAETAFETARALYDTEYDFLLDRTMAYLRAGNVTAASADIEQAIAQNPNEGRGYYVRANVATGQGDYFAASEDLEQAAELASAAGNTQLEAAARTQRAMVLQLLISQQATPTS
jgi:tetratricopeptide (TPR) repeat protein